MNTFSSLSQTTKRGTMTFRLAAFLVLWVLSTLPTIANATALADTGSDAHLSHAELFDGAEVRQLSTDEMSDTHGELPSPISIVLGAVLLGMIAYTIAGMLNNAEEVNQQGQAIQDLSNVDQAEVMNCAMNPCNGQIGVTADGTVGIVEDTSDNTTTDTTTNTTTTTTTTGPSGHDGPGVPSNSGYNPGASITVPSSVSYSFSYSYSAGGGAGGGGIPTTTVTASFSNSGGADDSDFVIAPKDE